MSFMDDVFAGRERERREPTMHGVALALVTGRMPDGTYSVKFLGMGEDAPSAPARMMMPNAGSKRGMYWMPEVGDEVVVAFEGGDSNAPIILGGVFNAQSPTPDQAKPSNENNVRTMVSRIGHEVTFDDTPGQAKVVVRTKEGRSLTLDDKAPGKITLETPAGISMTMDDGTGTLTLKAPVSIVLESASLVLSVAGMAVGPGASAAPGGVMSINLPAGVTIQSAAISMNAAAISLTTTGTMPTCAVIIDGKPFGLHVHGPPPPAPPVTPPVQP